MKTSLGVAAYLFALLSTAAKAQVVADPPSLRTAFTDGIRTFAFDADNDVLVGRDRFFTNGIRFALHATPRVICSGDERAPDCIKADQRTAMLARSATPGGQQSEVRRWITSYSLYAANNIYTASDIEDTPAELAQAKDERPYAGWAYVGASRTRTYDDDRIVRVSADLGCIGPCSGSGGYQTWWHENITTESPRPAGWSTQIGNEPVVLLTYRNQRLLWSDVKQPDASRRFDLAGHYGAQLGNIFTSASAGLTARVGIRAMRSYFAGHGLEPAPPSVAMLPSSHEGAAESDAPPEIFAFARVEGRAVAYNATIEGRLFRGPDPFARKPRRAVADIEVGVAAHFSRWSALLAFASRSTEIATREFDFADHRWGHVQFTYRLR